MKKYIYGTLVILCILCTSCTQNNGDIGDLYGYWRVTEEDNPTISDDDILWAFQNNILEITINTSHHQADKTYGTYTDVNDALRIDFTHWKDMGDRSYLYMMPSQLGLPADEPFVMDVVQRGGNTIVLKYEGRVFKLKKVY